MKFLGIEIIASPAVEPGQMLVRSGKLLYGWDMAAGGDTCVVAEIQPDGSLKVISGHRSDAAGGAGK